MLKDYFLKPKKIRNILETKNIPEDFLESLKKEKRKRIRQLSEKGVVIKIIENLDDSSFEKWLELYRKSIGSKEKGIEYASVEWLCYCQSWSCGNSSAIIYKIFAPFLKMLR